MEYKSSLIRSCSQFSVFICLCIVLRAEESVDRGGWCCINHVTFCRNVYSQWVEHGAILCPSRLHVEEFLEKTPKPCSCSNIYCVATKNCSYIWSLSSDFSLHDEGPCTIDVWDSSSLSYQQFIERYAYSRPVILRGLTDNAKFRLLCSKSRLLEEYGDRKVRLSTANTYSYRKVDVSFQEYVSVLLRPQSTDALGSDTLYFFGDNNFTEWQSLFEHYEPPTYGLPHTTGAYSFGIAGPGTGVPFHWHGPGYSEVIYGRKRWFLYPPDNEPHFHPNSTTLSWLTETYPNLPEDEAPLECTIRPGEVLYFPDRWWHATLNLDTSVFISTFLG